MLETLLYLLAASLFIFGLKGLSKVKTAPFGNQLAAAGMVEAAHNGGGPVYLDFRSISELPSRFPQAAELVRLKYFVGLSLLLILSSVISRYCYFYS